MENVATSAPPFVDLKSSREWRRQHGLIGILFFFLWFVLCRQLSGEWSVNEQYNYGWFVPFFAAYLFWLRWEQRPRLEVGGQSAAAQTGVKGGRALVICAGVLALFILFPVRLFEIANPDWRPLSWVHAFAVIAITFIVIYDAGGWKWVKHFSFPILFFLVAVPWVSPIEAPIVQGLMRGIAAIDSELLNLFGIPSRLEGSVIRISNGLVGVNEACSGVRSLQTSLMIALLFGELNRLAPWRRLALISGALFLALAANTIRAFFLVWLAATKGMSVMEKGHDFAGYGILAIVFLGSMGLAGWLKPGREVEILKEKGERTKQATPPLLLSNFSFLLSLGWLLAVEVGIETWYRLHERDLVPTAQWTVVWPETEPAFRKLEIDDRVRITLRYDNGGGATWRARSISRLPSDDSSKDVAINSLLYFFRWERGHSSVLRARAHRPDLCLPNTGWKQTSDDGVRDYPTAAGFALPFRHFEFAQTNESNARSAFAHAFFCIWQDRVSRRSTSKGAGEAVTGEAGDWIRLSDKVRAVREGQRELGQQVIELVLTGTIKISAADAEEIFRDQIKSSVKPLPAL